MRILLTYIFVVIGLIGYSQRSEDPSSASEAHFERIYKTLDKSLDVPEADSLLTIAFQLAESVNSDSLLAEVHFLNALKFHRKRNYEKSIPAWYESLALFEKAKNYDASIKVINLIGWTYLQFNAQGKADSIYQKGLTISDKFELKKINRFRINQGMATLKSVEEKHDEALGYFFKAHDFLDTTVKPLVGQYHGNIANCYMNLQRFDEAISSLKKSVNAYRETNSCSEMYAYKSLGALAYDFKKYDSAHIYFDAALHCAQQKKYITQRGYILTNKTSVYLAQENLKQAYLTSQKALEVIDEGRSPLEVVKLKIVIGDYLNKTGQHIKATKTCKAAFKLFEDQIKSTAYQGLCRCVIDGLIGQKKYKEAIDYYDKRALSVDSSNFQHLERKIAQKESEFKILQAKKKMDVVSQQKEAAYELNLLKQKNAKKLILGGLICLGFILGLLALAYHKRKKHAQALKIKNDIIQDSLEEKGFIIKRDSSSSKK